LPFDVSAGSFDVIVYDSTGAATTTTIPVTAATTLSSLATSLSGVGNFSASVTADGKLQMSAASGYTFGFANDTSKALVALGVNGLFTGKDARTIGVNSALEDNPSLLSSGTSLDVTESGDNKAALAMAALRTALILDNKSASINDFYESSVARLGVKASSAIQSREMEQGFVDDFQSRRLEVSGVSIDEEVTTMIQFQRAFEASSRVIGIVDRMLETLLTAF
jgi:flagellar hook-associated protein 1 FlgK